MTPDPSYRSLIERLHNSGVRTYTLHPDQLVISRQTGSAWPDRGNSFWISCAGKDWYLCTWGPVCYRVAAGTDLAELSVALVEIGVEAQVRVPAELIERFALVELDDEQTQAFLDSLRP